MFNSVKNTFFIIAVVISSLANAQSDRATEIKSFNDIQEGQVTTFESLAPKLKVEVCKSVKSVDTYEIIDAVTTYESVNADAYKALVQANQGGWNIPPIMKQDKCWINFYAEGMYKGSSYSKSIYCAVNKFKKDGPKSIHVTTIYSVCKGRLN